MDLHWQFGIARVVLLIASATLLTGCMTSNVIEKIWPTEAEPGSLIGITEVEQAALGPNESITLCTRGPMAESNPREKADFTVSVPAKYLNFRTTEQERWCSGTTIMPDPLPRRSLPAKHVVRGCTAAYQSSVPIISIKSDDVPWLGCTANDLARLRDQIMEDRSPTTVYVVQSYGWQPRIFLKYLSPLSGQPRVVELEVEPQHVKGNKAWLAALPAAILFDAVTTPFVLIYFTAGMAITGDSL